MDLAHAILRGFRVVALRDPHWWGRVLRWRVDPGIVRFLYVDGVHPFSHPAGVRLAAHVIGERPCRSRWEILLPADGVLPTWFTDVTLGPRMVLPPRRKVIGGQEWITAGVLDEIPE